DRVQHAVELRVLAQVRGHALGERVQVLLVGHVQLDDRRGLRQPLRDPFHQPEPAVAGEHDLRTLLLRHLGDVEAQRGVGDDTGDEQALALEESHGSLPIVVWCSGQWPMPRPPSTGMTAPVTYPAPSEPSHVTAEATSSGLAYRPSGTCETISARRSSGRALVMSVSTKPGATTLAVMPRDPSSRAIDRASPTSPALEAA